MNIFFKFEIDEAKGNLLASPDPQRDFIVSNIKKFFEEKLSAFAEEMKKEPDGCVVIQSLEPPEIRYYFSRPLALKLRDVITESAFRQKATQVYLALRSQ